MPTTHCHCFLRAIRIVAAISLVVDRDCSVPGAILPKDHHAAIFDRLSPLMRPDLRVYSPPGMLLTFLFHGVFRNQNEIQRHVADPQQQITLAHFRQFVEHMLAAGFQFVGPDDVETGLVDEGRYVMATFDDGYANNVHVQPILEEYEIPAVFFISTGHVLAGKPFWWDVLYRELWRRGASAKQICTVWARG